MAVWDPKAWLQTVEMVTESRHFLFFPLLTKTPLCESSDPAEATYQS